jgi:Alpha/beta hydrolase domain
MVVIVTAGIIAAGVTSLPANANNSPPVPRPVVTGPITGGTHGRPFTSSPTPLNLVGYTEQEFFLQGTATGYAQSGTWTSDGKWAVQPTETAPYETRILVRKPANPARFNGTVVVEWLNVSFNIDIDPDYLYESQQLTDAGYAWVGVSAQSLGVMGPLGLRAWDPARYGALHHPGDTFSYSIFSQAAKSLIDPRGARPLGSLRPTALIADGESQSAGRMVTYANAIQPRDRLFRGLLIHSRGAGGAPISQAPQVVSPMPAVAFLRPDLGVPVLTVETETDILANGLGFQPATQPDTRMLRLWEVAGTSHVDATEVGLTSSEIFRDVPTFPNGNCVSAPNDGDERFVMDAGLAQLDHWARTGVPAPAAARIDIADGAFVRDQFGNSVGGVRTPAVDAPVAALSGTGNSGPNAACFLLGTSKPLSSAALASLYPLHSDYVTAVQRSTATAVRDGFVLPADGSRLDMLAAGSAVGLPAPG